MFIINNIASLLLKLLSLLPFWLLHLKADVLFFFMYYIIGYRKKVVYHNLRNSFPEKSNKEIKSIARKFFINLCDVIVEQIKTANISKEEGQKRMVFKNVELLNELKSQNKSVIGLLGHMGNWEWVGIFSRLSMPFPTFALYKPLSNKFFDSRLLKIRTRFGLVMIPSQQAIRHFISQKNELTMTFMVADQTPIKSEIHYWTTFLNQDTPVFTGAEKIARSMGHAVVFIDIKRVRRGYYEVNIVDMCKDAGKLGEFEITERYMRLLENSITEQPEKWLWSHRRWKHKKEE